MGAAWGLHGYLREGSTWDFMEDASGRKHERALLLSLLFSISVKALLSVR